MARPKSRTIAAAALLLASAVSAQDATRSANSDCTVTRQQMHRTNDDVWRVDVAFDR